MALISARLRRVPRDMDGHPLRRDERLLGYKQIAEETGHTENNIRQLRFAGSMPEPDGAYGRSPVWYWSTIETWVRTHQKR